MFPEWAGASWERKDVLRYGENRTRPPRSTSRCTRRRVWPPPSNCGKQMSFNNYTDADAAWRSAHDFDGPAVAIINTPTLWHRRRCRHRRGAPQGTRVRSGQRVRRRDRGQPRDHRRDGRTGRRIFTEVLIAPGFADGALSVLTRKKNIRVLRAVPPTPGGVETRPVSGGLLIQQRDVIDAEGDDPANWTLAAGDPADADTLADLEFAWARMPSRQVQCHPAGIGRRVGGRGHGPGQPGRFGASGRQPGGERAQGSVAASDAFFPFPDGLQVLINGGVKAVVQPGGSIRDTEVIAAAAEAGVTLYLTGARHFAH